MFPISEMTYFDLLMYSFSHNVEKAIEDIQWVHRTVVAMGYGLFSLCFIADG